MMMTRTRTESIYSADDPLAQAIKPPTTESEEEKQARLKAEQEAKLVSDKIDDEIREERERRRRQAMEVKVSIQLS
jgi:guanine nucleotide-binding protein subunit alpha